MHVTLVNKKSHEFEKESGRVCGRVQRERKRKENDIIYYNLKNYGF